MITSPPRRAGTRSAIATGGRLARVALLGSCLLAAVGCPGSNDDAPTTSGLPFEGAAITLLVVDDPALAEAVRKLAGEWKAQTGSQLDVAECGSGELLAAKPRADAVIYPSHLLAELQGRDWIVPLPVDRMQGASLAAEGQGGGIARDIADAQPANEDGEQAGESWSDIFSALRGQEAAWGEELYAVPLGSPVLTCYYRDDLFERFNKRPPSTWAEYQTLCDFFRDRDNLGDAAPPADRPWLAAAEPLADGWCGLTLLARAAAYAKHPYYSAALFDDATMQPRIDQPPFVRALEELVQAAGSNAAELRGLDPAGCRAAFWRGECALALTWASAAGGAARPAEGGEAIVEAGIVELPGAEQTYDPGDGEWEDGARGEPRRVALLGIAGRLGSVVRGTQRHDAALQLLLSLAGAEWSERVLAASPATTLFRKQHLRQPRGWVEASADGKTAARYALVVNESLARAEYLFALRLPGRERYLAALDAAVAAVLAGESQPPEALRAAAEEWQEITEELGVDQQRAAYKASLGRL